LSSSCQLHLRDALLKGSERGRLDGRSTRFICGSAVDLEVEVKARRVREDLYYRISGVCLRLPPLRQRKEDIPGLMEHFLEKYSREYGRPIPKISAETKRLFQDYSWPGNVREFEDAVRVLVALGNEHLAMGGLRAMMQKRPTPQGSEVVSLKAASRAASHEAEKELILNVLTRTRWNRRLAAKLLQISYKALLYKMKQMGCQEQGLL
jgi:two-component system, NtrC family, response regulator AtoC